MRWPWRRSRARAGLTKLFAKPSVFFPDPSEYREYLLRVAPDFGCVEWMDDVLFPRIGPDLWGDWDWIDP